MSQIYHITTEAAWAEAQTGEDYVASSLDDEGFIHCSTLVQVIPVANAFYRDVEDLLLLCIEVDLLQAEVRWERPAPPAQHPDGDDTLPGDLFPHIYGTINLEAVVQTVALMRDDAGDYRMPDDLL